MDQWVNEEKPEDSTKEKAKPISWELASSYLHLYNEEKTKEIGFEDPSGQQYFYKNGELGHTMKELPQSEGGGYAVMIQMADGTEIQVDEWIKSRN